KVLRETVTVASQLLIEPLCCYTVQIGQIPVQHHALAAHSEDQVFDELCWIGVPFLKVAIYDLRFSVGFLGRFHIHIFRSRVRYWTASERCLGARFSAPSMSATVRATFKMRS